MPDKDDLGTESKFQTQADPGQQPQIVPAGSLTVEGATLLAQLLGRVQNLEGRGAAAGQAKTRLSNVNRVLANVPQIIDEWAIENLGAAWKVDSQMAELLLAYTQVQEQSDEILSILSTI